METINKLEKRIFFLHEKWARLIVSATGQSLPRFLFRFTPGNVSKHPITVPWMLACLDVSGGHIPLLKNQSQQVGAVCLCSLSAATRHRVLYTINRCFHWGFCLTNTLSLFVSSAAIGLLFLPNTKILKRF